MPAKQYLLSVLTATVSLTGLGALCSWLFLTRSGELDLPGVIAAQLADRSCLFGSAVQQDTFAYKMALLDARRPTIVVIGSSRVMQFSGRHFTRDFLNLGGVAGNVAALEKAVEQMSRVTPALVLIGVDFWWFNPRYAEAHQPYVASTSSYAFRPSHLLLPVNWLREAKIGVRTLGKAVVGRGSVPCRWGVMARTRDDGFDGDGFYHYTSFWTGGQKAEDVAFSDTLRRIAQGTERFEHGDVIAPDLVVRFADAVRTLKRRGAAVIVFLPPVAPTIHRALAARAQDYAFLAQLPAALAAAELKVTDFTDPAKLGASDCEFVDGFHGGEIASARLLSKLTADAPEVSDFIDGRAINATVHKGAGRSALPETIGDQEVDFLELGCLKTLKQDLARLN